MKLRSQSPLWRRIARRLGRQLFRLAENNDDPCVTSNGEGWLLHRLLAAHARTGQDRSFVVFDVGANVGDYTRATLSAARQERCGVVVHAFEPSPHNIQRLRVDFGSEPAVRIVGAALSDRNGEASLYGGRDGSSQASLVARERTSPIAATVTVPLVRLENYLEGLGEYPVDLLKLDVEGSELAVLKGLGDRLRPDIIDVIQFEYGGTAIDAGTTLRDLYRLLGAHGYVLAKLFPDAIETRGYYPWMEHYAYANYVALSPRWLDASRIVS
jgi:FkbM family methyltransferase